MNVSIRPTGGNFEPVILSEKDFVRISQIAKSEFGLNLEKSKRPMIQTRLNRRLRILGLRSFALYCDLVESANEPEKRNFVETLTTNVTHFYREQHHFDILENDVLPRLLAAAEKGRRVRLWSAGCSSGQEPYSLAGSLIACDANVHKYDVKILATDIDTTVLKTAEIGTYSASDCVFPSTGHRERLFGRKFDVSGENTVKPELKELISFRQLNLMKPWPLSGQFDVILCRNVAIYFDKSTQEALWTRFAKVLDLQGYLMIGHSERIPTTTASDFSAVGTTTYQLAGGKAFPAPAEGKQNGT